MGATKAGISEAAERYLTALDYLIEVGLAQQAEREMVIGRLRTSCELETAVSNSHFIIEAIVEDLATKQQLYQQVEPLVDSTTILSSTTSAISATKLQSALAHPERFAIAHYAQPGHLVKLVEVVPGEKRPKPPPNLSSTCSPTSAKKPVPCPDIPGFLWARIQHAILREFVSLVDKGLVTPEVCDTVLKEGYAVRLPARARLNTPIWRDLT